MLHLGLALGRSSSPEGGRKEIEHLSVDRKAFFHTYSRSESQYESARIKLATERPSPRPAAPRTYPFGSVETYLATG